MNQPFDTKHGIKEKGIQIESKHLDFNNSSSFQMVSKNLQIIKPSSWEVKPVQNEEDTKQGDQLSHCLIKTENCHNYSDNQAVFLRNIDTTSFSVIYLGHEGLSQSFMNEVKKMENNDMTESEFKELKTNLFEPQECINNNPLDQISEKIDNNQTDTNVNLNKGISEEKSPNDKSTKDNNDKKTPIKVKVRKTIKNASPNKDKSPKTITKAGLSPKDDLHKANIKNKSPQVIRKATKIKKADNNTNRKEQTAASNSNKDKDKKSLMNKVKQPINSSPNRIKSKTKTKTKLKTKNNLQKSNSKEHKLSPINKAVTINNKAVTINNKANGNDGKGSNDKDKALKRKSKKKLKPIKSTSKEVNQRTSPREQVLETPNKLMKRKIDQLNQRREKSLPSTRCLSKSKGGCPSSIDSPNNRLKKTMKKNLSLNDINSVYRNRLPKTTVSGEITSLKESGMRWIHSSAKRGKRKSPLNINRYSNLNLSKTKSLLPMQENFLDKVWVAIHSQFNNTGKNGFNGITMQNSNGNMTQKTNYNSLSKRKKKMIDDCSQTSELYYPKNLNRLMSNITQHYFNNKMQYYQTLVSNPFSPYAAGYSFQKLNKKLNIRDDQKRIQFPHCNIPQNKVLVNHHYIIQL